MSSDSAPVIQFDFTPEHLSGNAGLTFVARLARFVGLPAMLASLVRLKRRQRGCRDDQMLLTLIYSFCTGGGHLSAVDALAADERLLRASGLQAAPNSRRLGEYLAKMNQLALDGLLACVRQLSQRAAPYVIRQCLRQFGYVPVFVDGTAIEVQGQHFEHAGRGYNGERQYWLHSLFVGPLWISARLEPGGSDVAGAHWREQFDRDLAALLPPGTPVWLRADNAYYRGELVQYCQARGWDYSISLTNARNQAPIARRVQACEFADEDWTALDADGEQEAVLMMYRPSGWSREEAYVVIRRNRSENGQRQLFPQLSMILVSRHDLPLAELVQRHRAKQGQENAFKGPLTDLNLHHPPCKSYMANQAYYLCGQLAQLLLRLVQYQLLPAEARQHGLGPLIRDFVRTVARLTRSGRRLRVRYSRANYRRDWLAHAMRCLEPPG